MNDLLSEFDSFYQPPPPARSLPPTHRHTRSTAFDDLLSLSDAPLRPVKETAQRHALRPVSYHSGTTPDFGSFNRPHAPPDTGDNDEDDFGDFIDSPATTPAPTAPTAPTFALPPLSAQPKVRGPLRAPMRALPRRATPTSAPPIDDIPAVSVLLSLFPPLFLLPETHLLNPLKGLPFTLRQRVLADAKTKAFLQGVCEIGRVAGRIIAGRKRRGRKQIGGRKPGANHEAQKEEREVKEVCRLWKEGLAGRLKAAAGEAVPDIVEEGWRAVEPVGQTVCRLCKLGQAEIIPALREKCEKMNWWDTTWGGHASCRGFWERHCRLNEPREGKKLTK